MNWDYLNFLGLFDVLFKYKISLPGYLKKDILFHQRLDLYLINYHFFTEIFKKIFCFTKDWICTWYFNIHVKDRCLWMCTYCTFHKRNIYAMQLYIIGTFACIVLAFILERHKLLYEKNILILKAKKDNYQ